MVAELDHRVAHPCQGVAPGTASAAPKGRPGIDSSSMLEEDAAVLQASAAAEESARQSMVDMGFSSVDITAALERSDFAFGPALLLLLNGLEANAARSRQQSERFRRHVRKKTFAPKEEEALSGHPVFSQYTQRMFESFGISSSCLIERSASFLITSKFLSVDDFNISRFFLALMIPSS